MQIDKALSWAGLMLALLFLAALTVRPGVTVVGESTSTVLSSASVARTR